jgi:hypothetical protein
MERGTWTEDRLNAQAEKVQAMAEEGARLGAAVDSLTQEFRAFRTEMREEMREFRREIHVEMRELHRAFADLQGRLTMIGFGLVGTTIAAAVAIVLNVT